VTRDGRLREARAAILEWSRGTSGDACGGCVQVLDVAGASVSVLTGSMSQATLCATDEVAARIEELQLDLGQGPCWEAMDSRVPVLVPDVHDVADRPWPLFAASAQEVLTGGIFAFPLRVGAIDLGSLDVYRTQTGLLEPAVVHDAMAVADTMAWAVLQRLLADSGEDLAGWERDYTDSRREVHQATGMILAQVGTTATGAFALLRARAFSEGRTVRQVARDVIARRLSFAEPD
jgi:ANTAR domain-containing protein